MKDSFNHPLKFPFTLSILCALAISGGCSRSSSVSNRVSTIPPISNQRSDLAEGYGLDDIASHIFSAEGEVVQTGVSSSELKYINIKLIKPLPTAVGYEPYKTPGDIITIYFNTPASESVQSALRIGSVIRINYGQIDFSTNWGSNLSWVWIKQNGSFYDLKGIR